MATIITRAGKGSPLTNAELDANFTNLNTQLGGALFAALNLSDLANVPQARTNLGLGNVENKSSATIRGELTSTNVTTALSYTPYNATNPAGYITSAALSPYLTSATAAVTYQTLGGMSSYLTTSSAASTYLALAGGTTTGAITFNIAGSIAAKIGVSGLFSIGGEAGSADSLFTVTNGGAIGLEFSPTAIAGRNRILSYNRAATAFVPLNYAASEHNWDVSGTVRLSLTSNGLNLGGTANRITGDFSNATHANRVAFQSSTVNGATTPFLLPNGTGSSSGIVAANASDPTNCSFGQLRINGSTSVDFISSLIGTGTYLPMTFNTGGSERVRIDTSGNVGIGTSSPGGTLHLVAASANFLMNQYSADSLGPAAALAKSRGTIASPSTVLTGDSLALFSGGGYNTSAIVYNKAAVQMYAAENWTTTANGSYITLQTTAIGATGRSERMRINAAGNVSIATSNADQGKLTVFNTLNGSPATSGSNDPNIITRIASGAIALDTGIAASGVTWIQNRIANDYANNYGISLQPNGGNVGIGTLSPGHKLHVVGTGTVARFGSDATQNAYAAWQYNSAILGYVGNGAGVSNGSGATDFAIGSTGARSLCFGTNDTERARIDSSGNLLVGTTSASGNARVTITGGSIVANAPTSSAGGTYSLADNGSSPNTIRFYNNTDANNSTNRFVICDAGASVLRAEIRSNGGIANFQANNVNLSDRREKTNFAPAKSYLETICAIPVQTFNYIDQNMEEDGGLTLGVVAQDVQAVAPELVMESNWGSKDDPKMRLSVYQTDLQYALMKAIQELKAEFDAYKATHP